MNTLEVKNLSVAFTGPDGKEVEVVSCFSWQVKRSSITALVGESGCGKSVSTLALTRLFNNGKVKINAGAIDFFTASGGKIDLLNASESELRKVRGGKIGYIFQDPGSALNPVFRIGSQIVEVFHLHRPEVKDTKAEAIKLLNEVGIPSPERRFYAYPHELSGGMQQRVMIAMALAGNPELLIADEPTTALDVTIQAQILELLDRIRKERGMTVILITHNLGIVSELADDVGVMYAGKLVEFAAKDEIMQNPLHPYARALLAAVPDLEGSRDELFNIPGSVPNPAAYPAGCRFAPRCQDREKTGCDGTFDLLPETGYAGREHFCACPRFAVTEDVCDKGKKR